MLLWLEELLSNTEEALQRANSPMPACNLRPEHSELHERDALINRVCTELDLYNPSLSTLRQNKEIIKHFFIDEFHLQHAPDDAHGLTAANGNLRIQASF